MVAEEVLFNMVESLSDVATSPSNDLERNQSDYGDVFPPERSETLQRYMKTRDERDVEPSSYPPRILTSPNLGAVFEGDDSDSAEELEIETFQASFNIGRRLLDEEKWNDAEDRFLKCLKTLEKVKVEGAINSYKRMALSKPEIIRCLLRVYTSQARFEEAQSLLMEAISSDARLVFEMTALADTLYERAQYGQAIICGARALRAYRKTGLMGSQEEQRTLQLLVQICKAQGNRDEQMGYEDLLEQRRNNPAPQRTRSRLSMIASSDAGESSVSMHRDMGYSTYGPRSPSDRLSPGSRASGSDSQRSASPTMQPMLNTTYLPPSRMGFDDPLSAYSLPELTNSIGETPRTSLTTSMDFRNAQYRSGYFDPEPQFTRQPRTSNSQMYTPIVFERESDQVLHNPAQNHTDDSTFPSVKVTEAHDERGIYKENIPVPPRSNLRIEQPNRNRAISIPPRSNLRNEAEGFAVPPRSNLRTEPERRDTIFPLRPQRATSSPEQPRKDPFLRPESRLVNDPELDDQITPAPTATRESVRSASDYESEKEAYIPNNEQKDTPAILHSPPPSTAPSNSSIRIRPDSSYSSKPQAPQAKPLYKKVVVVGDSKCGKSPLLSCVDPAHPSSSKHTLTKKQTYNKRHIPRSKIPNSHASTQANIRQNTRPTGWDVQNMKIDVQGMRVDLVIWEIGGHDKEGLARLRSSPPPDAFLICFSIDSPEALSRIPTHVRYSVSRNEHT